LNLDQQAIFGLSLFDMRRKFYSKVLLFGEYTVTLKGEAFAIPNKSYFGRWEYGLPETEMVNELYKLANFANALPPELAIRFDNEEWIEDLDHGMYFKSNIPIGYGLGSSGALVAAFYNRFFDKPNEVNIPELKSDLGAIESYFHGTSSGFDPLVCFLDQAIHFDNLGRIQQFDANSFPLLNQVKLIDTKIERNTANLMQVFTQKLEDAEFKNSIIPALKKANAEAIQSLLNGDKKELVKSWKLISELQLQHFSEMIPESFKRPWQVGLAENQFIFKLCGAGGGGYILCLFPGNKGEGMLLLNGVRAESIKLES
jgi:mevalonate kinase